MKNKLPGALFVILVSGASIVHGNYSRKGGTYMGVLVIVAYRPLPGKEQQLLELTKQHLPVLRREGLATDRPSYAMRAISKSVMKCSRDSIRLNSSRDSSQHVFESRRPAADDPKPPGPRDSYAG